MRFLADKLSRAGMLFGLVLLLVIPQAGFSQAVDEDPSALAMAGDLVVARPLLLAATVAGTVFYVVSLPFSVAGGNALEAADTLIVGPGKATFVRCLGCTRSGYKKSIPKYED